VGRKNEKCKGLGDKKKWRKKLEEEGRKDLPFTFVVCSKVPK
jgi:hypothetical protein